MLYAQIISLFWPLYQITEVSNLLPFRFYILDFFVLLALVANIQRFRTTHPLFKPIFLFLSATAISLLISGNLFTYYGLYLVRFFLYLSLVLVIPPMTLIPSVFFLIFIGLGQYLLFPDLRSLKFIGFDDHYYRLTLPFFDPNFTGAALSFLILFFLPRWKQPFIPILISLMVICLALTFSRTSYLSLFSGIIFTIFSVPKYRKRGIILTLLLLLVIAIIPKPFGEGVNLLRVYSLQSRVEDIKQGFQSFLQHPIFGQPGQFNLNSRSNTPTNSYLFLLNYSGILGFFSFTYLLYSIFKKTPLNIGLHAAIISLLVHSLSNNTFFYSPILLMLSLFISAYGMNLIDKDFSA